MSTPSNLVKDSFRRTLRIDELEGLVPTHLYSAFDVDVGSAASHFETLIGTSEWQAPWQSCLLSFGFDFRFDPQLNQLEGLWTTLRSNVLLTDEAGHEQGYDRLCMHVARMMMRVGWENVVSAAVLPQPLH